MPAPEGAPAPAARDRSLGAELFVAPALEQHALLDSGEGEKLERYGPLCLRRPDPQALWRKRLPEAEWERADLVFVRESDRGGRWEARKGAPALARAAAPEWILARGRARFVLRPTPFKHLGLFPEQAANWELLERLAESLGPGRRLLDLFAYTGAAGVVALQSGFEVTCVDASRQALGWFRDNLRASGLPADAARVVLDDALAFARRELRRGARYEVLLLDPPHHGRGPKGERWQLERDLVALVETALGLLAPRGLLVLSTYAVGHSPLAFRNLLAGAEGLVQSGELALAESGPDGRLLPCGFCARLARELPPEALRP